MEREAIPGPARAVDHQAAVDEVQDVFTGANRPRYTKRQHAFAGLLTCGRCGCAMTAEIQKAMYIYDRRTGHRGPCGNTYVREEELQRLPTPCIASRI